VHAVSCTHAPPLYPISPFPCEPGPSTCRLQGPLDPVPAAPGTSRRGPVPRSPQQKLPAAAPLSISTSRRGGFSIPCQTSLETVWLQDSPVGLSSRSCRAGREGSVLPRQSQEAHPSRRTSGEPSDASIAQLSPPTLVAKLLLTGASTSPCPGRRLQVSTVSRLNGVWHGTLSGGSDG
jgi:hypothetical protein